MADGTGAVASTGDPGATDSTEAGRVAARPIPGGPGADGATESIDQLQVATQLPDDPGSVASLRPLPPLLQDVTATLDKIHRVSLAPVCWSVTLTPHDAAKSKGSVYESASGPLGHVAGL